MHVWALGLSCETTAAPPDRAPPTLRAPTLRGPTLRGPPPFGAPLFLGLAPHRLGPHHDTKNIGQKIGLAKKLDWPKLDWPKLDWPKLDWPKLVKSGWPKTGLAKVGLFRTHAVWCAAIGRSTVLHTFYLRESCQRACTHPPTGITWGVQSWLALAFFHTEKWIKLFHTIHHAKNLPSANVLLLLCLCLAGIFPLWAHTSSRTLSQHISRESLPQTPTGSDHQNLCHQGLQSCSSVPVREVHFPSRKVWASTGSKTLHATLLLQSRRHLAQRLNQYAPPLPGYPFPFPPSQAHPFAPPFASHLELPLLPGPVDR